MIEYSFFISIILNIILLIYLIFTFYKSRINLSDNYDEFENTLKMIIFILDTMLDSTWKNELSIRIEKYKTTNQNSQSILNNEIRKEVLKFVDEKSKYIMLLFNPQLRKQIDKHFQTEVLINFIITYLINGLNSKG